MSLAAASKHIKVWRAPASSAARSAGAPTSAASSPAAGAGARMARPLRALLERPPRRPRAPAARGAGETREPTRERKETMHDMTTIDAYGARIEPATVRIQRLLPGPVERVWAYLTESDLRRRWLASGEMDPTSWARPSSSSGATTSSPTRRASARRAWAASIRMQSHISEVDPPRLLAFAWSGGAEVTIELEPARGRDPPHPHPPPPPRPPDAPRRQRRLAHPPRRPRGRACRVPSPRPSGMAGGASAANTSAASPADAQGTGASAPVRHAGEQVEEPRHSVVHERGRRRHGAEAKAGQGQGRLDRHHPEPRPVEGGEAPSAPPRSDRCPPPCASASMKFGTVNATRRARPASARLRSTKPCASPDMETTRCRISQYRSSVGAAANGCPARTATTKSSA